MNLDEALSQLDILDEDAIICVRQPWTASAECVVVPPDDSLGIPRHVQDAGFSYFLEVHVAREVVGVFGDRPPTQEEKVRLLIDYALNDAYPDWVYRR